MVEKFSYHEALLGLAHVVGLADGENQKSETDTKVRMIMHEQISPATIGEFQTKSSNINNQETLFGHAIDTLKGCSKEQQVNACAWMYSVAVVAASGTDGELDYDNDNWITKGSNVNASEKVWVDKALSNLALSEDEVKAALNSLPEISRI